MLIVFSSISCMSCLPVVVFPSIFFPSLFVFFSSLLLLLTCRRLIHLDYRRSILNAAASAASFDAASHNRARNFETLVWMNKFQSRRMTNPSGRDGFCSVIFCPN